MKLKDNFQFPEDQKNGILILDSGIGALSLLESLNKSLPNIPLVAFADQKFFPYGEKKESEIIERLLDITKSLFELCKPNTILVACNTASTVVLPELRSYFDIPIVGIVPGIKPAAQKSKSRQVILLATNGTVNRNYTDRLIEDFAGNCEVVKVGSSSLASLAEEKIISGIVSIDKIKNELVDLKMYPDADCLILGCTHFSYLKDELTSILGKGITIIDPVQPVAEQVQRVNTSPENKNSRNFLLSSSDNNVYSSLDIKAYGISKIIYL